MIWACRRASRKRPIQGLQRNKNLEYPRSIVDQGIGQTQEKNDFNASVKPNDLECRTNSWSVRREVTGKLLC